MPTITVSGLGGKHTLDVAPEDTVRAVKQKLEPLTSLAAAEMKLLVKGKAPDDAATLSALGLSDGAKVMLMRSAQGAKTAALSSSKAAAVPGAPAWMISGAPVEYIDGNNVPHAALIKAVHTDDPAGGLYCTISFDGSERQTPADRLRLRGSSAATVAAAAGAAGTSGAAASGLASEAGSGPVALTVSNGKRLLTLRVEATTTVAELKGLLAPLTDADARTMKLLHKGKEATDALSVDALGLAPAGGKLMLLFRARHHKEVEGAQAVASAATKLAGLKERVSKTRHRVTKRLLTGAEAITELGALDEEVCTAPLSLSRRTPLSLSLSPDTTCTAPLSHSRGTTCTTPTACVLCFSWYTLCGGVQVQNLTQDLQNAAPNESSEAASNRAEQLAECATLAAVLAEARTEEAQAALHAQLGR